MGELRRLIDDCDDGFELLPQPSDCVDDEAATSLSPPPIYTQLVCNTPQVGFDATPPYTDSTWDLPPFEFPFDDAICQRDRENHDDLNKLFSEVEYPFDTEISPSELERYMDFTTPSSDFKLQTVAVECKQCKKTFLTLKGLRQHIEMTHLGDPSFTECDHDGRHFLRVDILQEDRNKSSHRKPDIICSKCGKGFTSASSMNRHSRLYCPSLRQESILDTVEESVAVGSDGGRHRCSNCGRGYIQKRNLTRHLRFECGVPPQFRCSQCDFKSNHKNNLKAHILNVHKSEYTK